MKKFLRKVKSNPFFKISLGLAVFSVSFGVSLKAVSLIPYHQLPQAPQSILIEKPQKEWTLAKLPPEVEEATKDWKTYVSMADPKKRFEIRYPKGWYTYPPQGRNPFDTITNFAGYNEDTDVSALSKDYVSVEFHSQGYVREDFLIGPSNTSSKDVIEKDYKIGDLNVTKITWTPEVSDETPGWVLEPGCYIYEIPDRNNRNKFLEVQVRPYEPVSLKTVELMLATARNLTP